MGFTQAGCKTPRKSYWQFTGISLAINFGLQSTMAELLGEMAEISKNFWSDFLLPFFKGLEKVYIGHMVHCVL